VDQGKVTEMDIDSYFDAVEGMSSNSTMS
jgi:hypothetical protein